MKYFLTIAFLSFSLFCFSQNTEKISTERQQAQLLKAKLVKNNNSLKTLTLNLVGVPKNNQGALKDDFSTYKKKVVSLDYDEFNETMVIKYSGLSDEKITSLLNKHQVNDSAIVNE
ncbi:MAG: hypothetical protein H6587_11170 [Flavobacteriales bacterium]|nr:hypothetical protein [Flavobacteriales bacterium]MCB9365120.1 hypothetical protein [Flavobacteriales bacterium]